MSQRQAALPECFAAASQIFQFRQAKSSMTVLIDKMHAYRDSIRSASDQRVVSYASILYPGPTVTYGPGLAAISARPSDVGFVIALEKILVGELLRVSEQSQMP